MDHVVIEDPSGARATVALDAVAEHKLRGFSVVGPANAPGDLRTVDEAEQEAQDVLAARAAVVKEVQSARKKPATKKEK